MLPTVADTPVAAPPVGDAPAVVAPAVRDATPQPIAEPRLIPVPAPVAAPPPKPARSNLPTPPPPRAAPGIPVAELSAPPVPQDDGRVAAAIADLAERLDVDPESIEVLDARQVTWRDGSVGCPAPGLAYSQAEVPGYLVVLRVDDASYRYHAADARAPFLCDTPQAPLEGSA